MSRHDPRVTLLQIREFASAALAFRDGRTLEQVLADWQAKLAFERAMELIGEAVKRLPPELRDRYPAVPWRLIAGLRDRVSHGYDAIDYTMLWDTVRDDVPPLLNAVEKMLKDLERPPEPPTPPSA
jgi:uncharacterized protein with HEPN domain